MNAHRADPVDDVPTFSSRATSFSMRGAHPVPQFRCVFTAEHFENILPWLMLNRQGLDVLVRPLTYTRGFKCQNIHDPRRRDHVAASDSGRLNCVPRCTFLPV